MTENEQIEEMHREFENWDDTQTNLTLAEWMYFKGYRKVERGEWRFIGNANGGSVGGTLYFKCPYCGYEITQARMGEANFCEWCGADMRGEGE